MAEEITLDLIARQLERVLNEQASMRDSITVLTGLTIRLEGAVSGLTTEIGDENSFWSYWGRATSAERKLILDVAKSIVTKPRSASTGPA
jgi:hypothetical protein